MLIPSILLSLFAGLETAPAKAPVQCAITEHSFEANNNTQQTLVVSFATPNRRSVLHLVLPSNGKLDFSFPEYALRGAWMEISYLSPQSFVSTGAMRLPNMGELDLYSTDGELRGTDDGRRLRVDPRHHQGNASAHRRRRHQDGDW